MYDIDMERASLEFARCWAAAGRHIETRIQGKMKSWLRSHLNPPFLEHLSFRLGNQLFFVRIEDETGGLDVPGTRAGLLRIADSCRGTPCVMSMRERAGEWVPFHPGWGLREARSGMEVDPVALVSDQRIEMTPWELQDLAVQVVGDHLKQRGRQLVSWQGDPGVDPSLWFVGEHGPEWVVVRAARFPQLRAARPPRWKEITEKCAAMNLRGHFASVAVANAGNASEPLWRGHALDAEFAGLESA